MEIFMQIVFVLNEQTYLLENGPVKSPRGLRVPLEFSSSMSRSREQEGEPTLLGQ
jgi:hypothetical protein